MKELFEDTLLIFNTGDNALALFKRKTRVLFVCTENICRSPMAEGLLRHHLQQAGLGRSVKVSSAGTRASMPGARPDQRAQKVAIAAGIDLGRIRASRVSEKDLIDSDYIFALDRSHLQDLLKACQPEHRHKISLLLAHLPGQDLQDVPDPYYNSHDSFGEVFTLIESAVVCLVPLIGAAD